jgi:hypothetical protein
VLGSAISVLPTFWLEKARTRRDRDAETERAAEAMREAGRLVAEELREAERQIESAARRGRYWPGLVALPTIGWETYRTVLARQLGPADWGTLADAFDHVMRLNRSVNERRGRIVTVESRTMGEPVSDDDDLPEVWSAVRYAIWALDAEVGIPRKVEHYLEESRKRSLELWPEKRT